tara:strand:+ start:549 stop:1541 length:993 start_codon:yes stop_codon:yes gene_type:complete
MKKNLINRRKFLDLAKLSFVFFITSCRGLTNKTTIGFHKKFIPDNLISSLPKNWIKKNINFEDINLNKNIKNHDLIIINDGWLNKLRVKEFNDINSSLINILDKRSSDFLKYWDINERKKIYPIGIIPYVLVIKNNDYYKISKNSTWDILTKKEFKGKIILPNSTRILISLAEKINNKNSIKALINQDNIYDDKNAIDWLVNTNAILAIMPISYCHRYLKFDSRLSLVFPDQGVPLIWNFLLINNDFNQQKVIDWTKNLSNKNISNKLQSDGWYFPFNNNSSEEKYKFSQENKRFLIRPSEECWKNSWSLPPLKDAEKIKIEKLWKESLD